MFHPLGFALEVATNSAAVEEAARLSWGRFSPAFHQPPIRLRVIVEEGASAEMPAPPAYRAQAGVIAIVGDAGNFAMCDCDGNHAFAFVTPAVAANAAYFCYYFLEGIAFSILTHRYLAPVHAAAVAREGRGILLCGESGAGKSSLSYACARAGWTYVSDNAAYLVRGSAERRVLGDPHSIRLRADAPGLFPELQGRLPADQINGKLAIVLETAGLPRIRTGFECRTERLVFLNRNGGGPAGCCPVSREEVFHRLQDSLPRYPEAVQRAICGTLQSLAEVPAFEMRYGELSGAVRELESLLGGS